MKKQEVSEAVKNVAKRVYFDYKAGKLDTHDDLLNAVDVYLDQAGLSSFEYGDDAVEMAIDDFGLAVCDHCGRLMSDAERVDVGEATTLRASLMNMSRAGEVDYLRDDVKDIEVVCPRCEHIIYEYVPKFTWGGAVYSCQAEIEADEERLKKFQAEGWATIDELPRPLILHLKQMYLDNTLLEEKDETASMGELVCADYLLSDEKLRELAGGTRFTFEDFCGTFEDFGHVDPAEN